MKKILLIFLIYFGLTNFFILQAQNEVAKEFNSEEIQFIYQADSAMRVWKITNETDSIFLRQKSWAVIPNDKDTVLTFFIDRLFQTVQHPSSMGVGIAAPQVGVQRQIIWVQRLDKEAEKEPFEVYLNPKIVEYSDSTKFTNEGCLSIPDRRERVERPSSITIEYDKLDGSHHQEVVSGFTAVIFQHEIDHLNGILYLDHLNKEARLEREEE